jgi:soluble lytic murein transglycosylase-like protein
VYVWATLSLIGLIGHPAPEPVPETVRLERIIATLAEHAAFDQLTRHRLGRELVRVEAELGIDPLLVVAVMERESRFDPHARGVRGGLGLMQVRPVAAAEVSAGGPIPDERSIFEPATNVRLGSAYLARLQDLFGDWELALTAYNMGPTRLRELLAAGRTPTYRYASAILARYRELSQPRAAGPPGPLSASNSAR